ncbi:MAG: transposase [Pseudomonadota bacterium]
MRTNLVTLPLYEPSGQLLDVLRCVRKLKEGECGAWTVHVQRGKKIIAGRLCAVRKDAASAEKARQRVRRESQRSGTQIQEKTLEAAGYVLVFTTLGEDFPAEQIMELYRARWQIELVFKRLKSLAQLGHLKKRDPRAARAWLQGKLLAALLIDILLASAEHFSPWGLVQIEKNQTSLCVA